MPGPDVVGDWFAVAATADMSLSGELLQFENGVLVPEGVNQSRLWREHSSARPMPQQDCLPQRVPLAVLHRLGQVRY